MKFDENVRGLPHNQGWAFRDLTAGVDVGFAYLSRIESERLNFGDADDLEFDEESSLMLAKRSAEPITRGRAGNVSGTRYALDVEAPNALVAEGAKLVTSKSEKKRPSQKRFP